MPIKMMTATAAVLAMGLVTAPALAGSPGVARNQAALAAGGYATPAITNCAATAGRVIAQCNVAAGASHLNNKKRGGALLIGAGAAAAIGLGAYIATEDDGTADNPISS